MKLPNRHKLGTLTALAILLAGISTGCLTLCEIFLGAEPEEGPPLTATVQQGNTAQGFAALVDFFSRYALCDLGPAQLDGAKIPAGASTTVPDGVYVRVNRDLRGEPTATADLVTALSTPVGVYVVEYRDASPGSYVVGQLTLTIEAAPEPEVTACMAVFGEGEVIIVNQTVNFYGCCSSSDNKGDPIVQYKWWFNYNGNPSSTPSQTTTTCQTTTTYGTAGPRTTRLVVRTQSGLEAEDTQQINVLSRGQ